MPSPIDCATFEIAKYAIEDRTPATCRNARKETTPEGGRPEGKPVNREFLRIGAALAKLAEIYRWGEAWQAEWAAAEGDRRLTEAEIVSLLNRVKDGAIQAGETSPFALLAALDARDFAMPEGFTYADAIAARHALAEIQDVFYANKKDIALYFAADYHVERNIPLMPVFGEKILEFKPDTREGYNVAQLSEYLYAAPPDAGTSLLAAAKAYAGDPLTKSHADFWAGVKAEHPELYAKSFNRW